MAYLHHISVTIATSGEIARFIGKLPAKAAICCGIYVSANTHHASHSLSQACINFNGDKDQVINLDIRVNSLPKKTEVLSIFQHLTPNASIQGYVKDFGVAPAYPYTVKIYFKIKD